MAVFNQSLLDPIAKKAPGVFDNANPSSLVTLVFQSVIDIAAAVFLVMLLWGGLLYLTAAGNDESVEKAKKTITQALVGLLIVVASFGLGTWILGLLSVTQNSSTNTPANYAKVTLSAIERPNGSILNTVKLYVKDNKSGDFLLKAETGSNNNQFSVSPGKHEIEAKKDGYATCSEDLDFASGTGKMTIWLYRVGTPSVPHNPDCKKDYTVNGVDGEEKPVAPATLSVNKSSTAWKDGYKDGVTTKSNGAKANPLESPGANKYRESDEDFMNYSFGYDSGYESTTQTNNTANEAYGTGFTDGVNDGQAGKPAIPNQYLYTGDDQTAYENGYYAGYSGATGGSGSTNP